MGLVCRSWLEAVAGPYCWTDIDIEQWCRRSTRPLHLVDSTIKKLVRRSKCTFTRISAYKLGDSAFSFIANCNDLTSHILIDEVAQSMYPSRDHHHGFPPPATIFLCYLNPPSTSPASHSLRSQPPQIEREGMRVNKWR
ncbi:F-box protein FBW2 [Camellia lanceoleosa]|nr:F-box protein FBW2 [Camellia lanceoleosa]